MTNDDPHVITTSPVLPVRPLLDVDKALDDAKATNPHGAWIEDVRFRAALEEQAQKLVKEAHDVGFRRGLRERHDP